MKKSRAVLSLAAIYLLIPSSGASAAQGSDPNLFVGLAKKLVPSVVNIQTTMTMKTPYAQGAPDDLFRKFFEDYFRHQSPNGVGPRGNGGEGDEDDEGQGMMPPPNGPHGGPPGGGPKGQLPKAMS